MPDESYADETAQDLTPLSGEQVERWSRRCIVLAESEPSLPPDLPPIPDEPLSCSPQALSARRRWLRESEVQTRQAAIAKRQASHVYGLPRAWSGLPPCRAPWSETNRCGTELRVLEPVLTDCHTRVPTLADQKRPQKIRKWRDQHPKFSIVLSAHRVEVFYNREAVWVITAQTPAGDAEYERRRRDPYDADRLMRRVQGMILARLRFVKAHGGEMDAWVFSRRHAEMEHAWRQPIPRDHSLVPVTA